jgi:hypothetical protein
MTSLNSAIQLIREGRKEEARQILEPLLKAEPSNVHAWFWYVETCATIEKRIQILEICLRMNPGNSQVIQALSALRNQRPAQITYTPPLVDLPKPVIPKPQEPSYSYSAVEDGEPESLIPYSYTPAYFDDEPTAPLVESASAPQQKTGKQKKAWEGDAISHVDTFTLSKPKPAPKSHAFYYVWMTALAPVDVVSSESIFDDPEAGSGRAFEWVAYAGIISGLIFPFTLMSNPQFAELKNMPQFRGLLGSMNTTVSAIVLAFAMALLTPIISVIGLAISAGIQNFLAVLFGGEGDYSRTVYALAAYLAPMTLLVSLLGMIPLVGQCLTSVLGFYNIVLNVRALQAAHSLSVWRALGVMLAPGILILVFGCLIFFVISLSGGAR